MLLSKFNVPSCTKVSRKAAKAHGAGCACCRPARVAVRVSAAAPQAAQQSSLPKDGLQRIVDEDKVRESGRMGGPGARGARA